MKLAPRFLLSLFLVALAGCSTGGPGEISQHDPSEQGQNVSGGGNGAPPAGTTPATNSNGSSSLGAQCTAYLACCDQLAAKNSELASSCASTKTSIERVQASGQGASLESSCKSGLDAYKSAGYCG